MRHIVKILISFFLIFFNSCTNFKPLYEDNLSSLYKLQEFSIITDKREISKKVKKNLLELFPNNKKTSYILKIEAVSDTSGVLSDTTRKISRYKTQVSANIKLYYRYKKYDKLIHEFNTKSDASYSLILNNIRSTIASRKSTEATSIKLLSEEIYRRVLIFLSKN